MPRVNAGHFVLGIEGLALLRRWLVSDEDEAARRVRALAELAGAPDAGPLAWRFEAPDQDVADGYARWSESYDHAPNPLIQIEEPVVRAVLDACPAGEALDAACGTGRHAAYLAARGHRVVGIDATAEMLDKARARVLGAEFQLGSLAALPLPDASVDLAVCALALTHVVELAGPIAELARVVRPGGQLVLSDLHPTIMLLGGGALFFDQQGAAGNVRSYHHPHTRYLEAFRRAGLELIESAEPVAEAAHLPAIAGPLLPLAEEAFATAYLGLPFALVWRLAKPKH